MGVYVGNEAGGDEGGALHAGLDGGKGEGLDPGGDGGKIDVGAGEDADGPAGGDDAVLSYPQICTDQA